MSTTMQVARGGIGTANRGSNTVSPTGGVPAITTTQGTDTTPAITETYISAVNIGHNATITGVAILNGSAVAGNVTVALYDANGCPIAVSASTAQSGTAAYQSIAFTAPVQVQGPGRYYVGVQFSSTSARFRTHILGVFPAFKTTGDTYGTVIAITPASTFTTAQGPIASTY